MGKIASFLARFCPCKRSRKELRSIAIVAHETKLITDTVLTEALQLFDKVIFVPMREQIHKDFSFPIASSSVLLLRGESAYKQMLLERPDMIVAFNASFIEDLLKVPSRKRPKAVFLFSRASVKGYAAYSDKIKRRLSQTTRVISFADSRLKKPDCYHGVGESIVQLLGRLGMNPEKEILLIGYGGTGEGIAHHLREGGYRSISVFDRDPVALLLAHKDGFRVAPMDDLCRDTDLVIAATGERDSVTEEMVNAFRKPDVLFLATGTNRDSFYSLPQQNAHGTHHTVDPSLGMANLYYGVGGSSDEHMEVTTYAMSYLPFNYRNIFHGFVPSKKEPYLWTLSDPLERQMSVDFLKDRGLLN